MHLRVLLIEDSEDDAALLVRELRRGGYVPEWRRVETPEGVHAALDAQVWDLITCDWVMPRFSAPVALDLLRERNCDLPVIIVSGEVGEEVAVSALRSGACDFVSKHRLTRLLPAVARELRESAERQARRRAQRELQQAQERLRLFIEHADDAIFTLDEHGYLRSVNRAATRITGFAAEELVGRPVWDLIAPSARPLARRALARVHTGEADALPEEYELIDRHGARHVLEIRGRTVHRQDGVFESFHIARDITARRRGEAERAWLSAALEQAPDAIVIVDLAGTVLHLNAAGERLNGGAARGAPYMLQPHPGDGAPRHVLQLLRSDGTWEGAVAQRDPDGRVHRLDIAVAPIRAAGGEIVNYLSRGIVQRTGA